MPATWSTSHEDGAIVPADDALADRVWEAGLKMAEDLGFFSLSTSRRMLFTRDEIITALGFAPTQVTVGTGLDKATEVKRKVEDTRRIFIKGGIGNLSAFVESLHGLI